MTDAIAGAAAPDNFASACCGCWAQDRARLALYCEDAAGHAAAWTFWDVQREANRFSNVLAALGVMRGERVALMLAQRAETAALLVACWQMGAVAVPLSERLAAADLARALATARARVVVAGVAGQRTLAGLGREAGMPRHAIGVGGAHAAGLRDWAALRPLASPHYAPLAGVADAPALLLSSGATAVTHGELMQAAARFAAAHPGYPQPGDLFWSAADWASAAGLLEGLLPAWQRGQPVVAYDGEFGAAAAFQLIAKYDVRNALVMPWQLEAMMAGVPKPSDSYDCRLRTLASAGAAPSGPLAAWLEAELGIAGKSGLA